MVSRRTERCSRDGTRLAEEVVEVEVDEKLIV